MKVIKFIYDLSKPPKMSVVVEEDSSPLTQAVQAEAERRPGEIVMGVQDAERIVYVGPLEAEGRGV